MLNFVSRAHAIGRLFVLYADILFASLATLPLSNRSKQDVRPQSWFIYLFIYSCWMFDRKRFYNITRLIVCNMPTTSQ